VDCSDDQKTIAVVQKWKVDPRQERSMRSLEGEADEPPEAANVKGVIPAMPVAVEAETIAPEERWTRRQVLISRSRSPRSRLLDASNGSHGTPMRPSALRPAPSLRPSFVAKSWSAAGDGPAGIHAAMSIADPPPEGQRGWFFARPGPMRLGGRTGKRCLKRQVAKLRFVIDPLPVPGGEAGRKREKGLAALEIVRKRLPAKHWLDRKADRPDTLPLVHRY
jgi:hypothetical protein